MRSMVEGVCAVSEIQDRRGSLAASGLAGDEPAATPSTTLRAVPLPLRGRLCRYAVGAGFFCIAPVMGMKNTPTSRRLWTLPSASLV